MLFATAKLAALFAFLLLPELKSNMIFVDSLTGDSNATGSVTKRIALE